MDTRRYLYHARVNSHLTLEQIGLRTALSPTVLRNLDEGRFERLPSGLYARSYVRAFAAAVGLDPREALATLEHLLPGTEDPASVPAETPPGGTRASNAVRHACTRARAIGAGRMGDVIATATSLRDMLRTEVKQSQWSIKATTGLSAHLPALSAPGTERFVGPRAALLPRLSLATEPLTAPAPDRSAGWVRHGAALVDALILLVIETCLLTIVAESSGVGFERLLEDAGLALATFCAIPLLFYFLFFEGIAGSTPGRRACRHWTSRNTHSPGERSISRLTLRLILQRTLLT